MIASTKEPAAEEGAVGTPTPDYLAFGMPGLSSVCDTDFSGAHDYLERFGFGASGLTEARGGTTEKESIGDYVSPGTHYCDFCGRPMAGAEFERLKDGRERCNECSKSVLHRLGEYEELFSRVKRTMAEKFKINFPKPVQVRVVSQRKLAKISKTPFIPTPHVDARTLGLAWNDGKRLRMYFESGSPRLPLTATSAHELTHIWQYTHWDIPALQRRYGDEYLDICEGMAKWVEIQYLYLINESAFAARSLAIERIRDDEYGRGLRRYLAKYRLSAGIVLTGRTPFANPKDPLV